MKLFEIKFLFLFRIGRFTFENFYLISSRTFTWKDEFSEIKLLFFAVAGIQVSPEGRFSICHVTQVPLIYSEAGHGAIGAVQNSIMANVHFA